MRERMTNRSAPTKTELEKATEAHRDAARRYIAKAQSMREPFTSPADMNATIQAVLVAELEHRRAAIDVRELSCSILGYEHSERLLDELFSKLAQSTEAMRIG